jgi:hypothetical protein
VAAETARMSLEEEVDQATAKAIGASESNGAPRPVAESTGAPGFAGSGRPAGPGGLRPTAPQPATARTPGPGGPAQPRPTQPSQSPPLPSPPSAQAQSAQAQEKQHAPARHAVIDAEESVEGVRLMPRGDNLGLPPSWR